MKMDAHTKLDDTVDAAEQHGQRTIIEGDGKPATAGTSTTSATAGGKPGWSFRAEAKAALVNVGLGYFQTMLKRMKSYECVFR